MDILPRTTVPFTVDEEINFCREFTRVYKEHLKDTPAVREAACIDMQYPAIFCPPQPGDVFVGRQYFPLVMFTPQANGLGYCYTPWRLKTLKEDKSLTPLQRDQLAELEGYWKHENTSEFIRVRCSPLIRQWLPSDDYGSARQIGHPLYRLSGSELDFKKLLTLGVDGLHKLISEKEAYADEEAADLYFGLHSVLTTFEKICKHYIRQIRGILQDENADENWKKELAETQKSLVRISHAPASSFRDAIQLVYLWWLYSGSINFGRMDTYLAEYYVHDVDNGIITEEEALHLLVEFWRFMELRHTITDCRVFVGGKGRKNEEICDRFALLAIRATREFHYILPQLSLRIYKGMNPAVYEAAMEAIGEGCTFPILYNDDANIPAVSRAFEVSEEVAETYCPFGCGEYVLEHTSIGTPSGLINLTKALEATLFHGRDAETGAIIGIDVGGLETYKTFDELVEAYKKQVEHIVPILAKMEEAEYVYGGKHCAFLTFSLLFDDCIARGRALLSGGVRYMGGTLESYGNVNAADSLTAIKKTVYEDKSIKPEELLDALRNNFEGTPELRKKLLDCPKYGNENEEADKMLQMVHDHVCNTTRDSVRNTIMHSYLIVVINNSANTTLGHLTSASADGRLSGLYLANANNPQGGADTNGLTAMLNSIVKPAIHHHAGCVQNLKLSKEMFSEKMLPKTRALLDAYFHKGGAQIMITVVSRDEMEDAVVHPENHKDLIVRVGGFSARFIDLSADVQRELLSRTLHG